LPKLSRVTTTPDTYRARRDRASEPAAMQCAWSRRGRGCAWARRSRRPRRRGLFFASLPTLGAGAQSGPCGAEGRRAHDGDIADVLPRPRRAVDHRTCRAAARSSEVRAITIRKTRRRRPSVHFVARRSHASPSFARTRLDGRRIGAAPGAGSGHEKSLSDSRRASGQHFSRTRARTQRSKRSCLPGSGRRS